MIELKIPVPPARLLERAVGYTRDAGARYLALWWTALGDEVMVSDGFVTFTGNWQGYLAYVHYHTIYPTLRRFELGSSEEEARDRLVIDLLERKAWLGAILETEHFLASQWKKEAERNTLTAYEDLEFLIRCFLDRPEPSQEDVLRRMAEDRQAVEELRLWLDRYT